MNTNTDTEAGVKPALQITEADVVAFFKEKAAQLSRETAISYASVSLTINASYDKPEWRTYVDGSTHVTETTLAEALSRQVQMMTPETIATRLRREAAEMLARANTLAPEAAQ